MRKSNKISQLAQQKKLISKKKQLDQQLKTEILTKATNDAEQAEMLSKSYKNMFGKTHDEKVETQKILEQYHNARSEEEKEQYLRRLPPHLQSELIRSNIIAKASDPFGSKKVKFQRGHLDGDVKEIGADMKNIVSQLKKGEERGPGHAREAKRKAKQMIANTQRKIDDLNYTIQLYPGIDKYDNIAEQVQSVLNKIKNRVYGEEETPELSVPRPREPQWEDVYLQGGPREHQYEDVYLQGGPRDKRRKRKPNDFEEDEILLNQPRERVLQHGDVVLQKGKVRVSEEEMEHFADFPRRKLTEIALNANINYKLMNKLLIEDREKLVVEILKTEQGLELLRGGDERVLQKGKEKEREDRPLLGIEKKYFAQIPGKELLGIAYSDGVDIEPTLAYELINKDRAKLVDEILKTERGLELLRGENPNVYWSYNPDYKNPYLKTMKEANIEQMRRHITLEDLRRIAYELGVTGVAHLNHDKLFDNLFDRVEGFVDKYREYQYKNLYNLGDSDDEINPELLKSDQPIIKSLATLNDEEDRKRMRRYLREKKYDEISRFYKPTNQALIENRKLKNREHDTYWELDKKTGKWNSYVPDVHLNRQPDMELAPNYGKKVEERTDIPTEHLNDELNEEMEDKFYDFDEDKFVDLEMGEFDLGPMEEKFNPEPEVVEEVKQEIKQ